MKKNDLKLPPTAQKALEEFLFDAGESAKSENGSIRPSAWANFMTLFLCVTHERLML
jgi:hypothetical protein